ncbi:hypothetical protein [Wolbachia pipientis]
MSPLDPSALFLSSQCPILVIPVPYSCHPSALFLSSQCPILVIPVPRHWDLILLYNDVMKVADTGIQKT